MLNSIKSFLKKWVLNNIGYKILALVFAFVMWLVIMNITDPVITKTVTNIPVVVENEDKVLDGTHIYTVVSGDTATIVVSGNRSIVGGLSSSDFIAKANMEELSITNAVPITVELSGDYSRFAGSVNIAQKTNSMIVSIENMAEKSLSVEVEFTGKEPEDLLIEDAVSEPAKVTLYAPETVIKQASKAVARIPYSDITGDGTIYTDVMIFDGNDDVINLNEHSYLDVPTVGVNISTSAIKSLPISIYPMGEPNPGYKVTDIVYSKNEIKVRGDKEVLDALSRIDLPSWLLDVSGKDKDVTISVNLIDYLPYGVVPNSDSGTITIVATISKR